MKKDYFKRSAEIENPIVYPSLSVSKDEYSVEKNTLNKKRMGGLFGVAMFFLTILVVRIFYLQIVRGSYYQNISEKNRIKSIIIKAPRGLIKDKNKKNLAQNIPSFDLVFVPANIPQAPEKRKEIFLQISQFSNIDYNELEKIISSVQGDIKAAYLLKENIEKEKALMFFEKATAWPGFYLEKTAIREYIDGEIFSHLIGYTGKISREELKDNANYLMTDSIGKNGIEYTYEKWLKGEHGYQRVEVDSTGNIKEELGVVNPQMGNTLVLNIDGDLQKKANEVFKKILEENKSATAASLVAINPQNGAVLALVNIPNYNNNLFSKGILKKDLDQLLSDKRKPMLNRAISGEYPPGSTFKPFIALAALEEKIINENTVLDCNGLISVGQWKFPDWKTHGPTDIKKAIAESCNVFFYAIGGGWENISGLGIERIKKYAEFFGFGNISGIDLPWEASGNIPDKEWKFKKVGENWYVGDDYHAAIGQGFITVTPLQLAVATATIANGGSFYRPQIVDKIIDVNGREQDIEPEKIADKLFSVDSIEVVRKGMRQTIMGESGSGRLLASLSQITAGKTGTAQFGNEDKTHSWFISFGPYDNPEIAMAILIEGGGEGHDWATPAAKEIYEWYFSNN